MSGEAIDKLEQVYIYPAKHFVLPEERIHSAVDEIRRELRERLELFKSQGKLLEAQRLSARTRYDVEMMMEMGYCPGIENYSRPLSGRKPGEPPYTLFDFFPEGLLAVRRRVARHGAAGRGDVRRRPQPQGNARRAWLPAAQRARQPAAQVRRVAASGSSRRFTCRRRRGRTSWSRPAAKWSSRSCGRPGLLDPVIEVVSARGQVPHLLEQIRERAAAGERVLVTTLTKRLAEDLADYFTDEGVLCKWLHSELDAFERVELLRDLRQGKFEALVGVNLLREGLDLPEVSLVAILDADKEGFLRSETSLMQTIGRAARNVNAKVILYADRVTEAMQRTIEETARRRAAAGGVQPRARHHAGDDQEGDLRGHRSRRRPPTPRRTPRSAAPTRRSTSPRSTSPSWKRKCSRRPRRWNSSGRRRSAIASARCATRSASRWRRCASGTARAAKNAAGEEKNGRPGRVERPRAAAETNALMSFIDGLSLTIDRIARWAWR